MSEIELLQSFVDKFGFIKGLLLVICGCLGIIIAKMGGKS